MQDNNRSRSYGKPKVSSARLLSYKNKNHYSNDDLAKIFKKNQSTIQKYIADGEMPDYMLEILDGLEGKDATQ